MSVRAIGYSEYLLWPKPKNPNLVTTKFSLIKATPAKYLGQVFATTEAEAIKEAVKEFRVAENLRDRIVARKEDY